MIERSLSRHLGIFLLVFASSGCLKQNRQESQTKAESPGKERLNFLVKAQGKNIERLMSHLTKIYSPKSYKFIFLGRSPTPLYAMMTSDIMCPEMGSHYSVPFSDGGELTNLLEQKKTSWATIFRHLDTYLGGFLKCNYQHPNLVIVDYVESGQGLGTFIRVLNEYLNTIASERPGWKKPRFHYIALAGRSQNDKSFEVIQNAIVGGPPLAGSKYPLPRFSGSFIDLSYFGDLEVALGSSAFDGYSPYGPWTVLQRESSAHRQLRPGFKTLRTKMEEAGLSCSARLNAE